jgi:hypothetical protein
LGGLQSIARLTANEYRDLMKVMVFVVDDLLQDKNLSKVYVKWNEMYLMSRLETFKESDLQKFQVKIIAPRSVAKKNKILTYLII